MLLSFGIFYGLLVYISHFGMLCQEKSGNPDFDDAYYTQVVVNNEK
jgi:hypothetical protein